MTPRAGFTWCRSRQMDTIPGFLFALLLLTVTFAPGCIGGGVFSKERLVGRFAMWAVDGLSDNSVVEESEDRRAASVLIPPTVFAVGSRISSSSRSVIQRATIKSTVRPRNSTLSLCWTGGCMVQLTMRNSRRFA